jgi:hypothetical protein
MLFANLMGGSCSLSRHLDAANITGQGATFQIGEKSPWVSSRGQGVSPLIRVDPSADGDDLSKVRSLHRMRQLRRIGG